MVPRTRSHDAFTEAEGGPLPLRVCDEKVSRMPLRGLLGAPGLWDYGSAALEACFGWGFKSRGGGEARTDGTEPSGTRCLWSEMFMVTAGTGDIMAQRRQRVTEGLARQHL